mmetsp:Transcript_37921/g.61173  ORF Transcript_37921/g.61173 Transcript_37921/m.61173 type:complete len:369 (+) Transcript_37921:9-1115(+)
MTRINAQRVAQAAVGTLALAAVCAVLFPPWQHRTVLLDREQKLAYWDNDSFAGYQGLPSHVVSQKGTEGTWMDGSRGTEHLPHKLFNKLQAAEHAAGIEGDSEGADNFQTGEGLNAPAVQAWKSPQQILYQKVQHDADASASHDGVDDGLEASAGAQPEAFIDIMDKQPYYQMSAPMSDEQYFDTPPFSAKGRRLPQLVVRRQMALHAQHEGLISKESDAQHAEHEEQEFMREAHSFLGQQNKPVEGAPQDKEQASFVAEAHQFLKGGAAAGNSHEEEASPWEWVREEHAAEEEQESDEEQKAFARDAQVWLANGQDKAFAMPAPSHLFFDDEGITRKDWVDEQSHASEEQEGGPGAFAGKALLLGEA